MASSIWLLFISVKVSLAKVENVVKPPQKPVIIRRRKLLDGIRFANRPIQKHPNILIEKVATGKIKGSNLIINTDARKRKTLPTAPPAPTKIICFNIVQIYIIILEL